jgi:hypothetical protein
VAAVARYGSLRWSHIARALPGRTSKACSHRWHTHLAPGAKRHGEEQEPFSDWELAVIREVRKRVGGGASARKPAAQKAAACFVWRFVVQNASPIYSFPTIQPR